MTSEDSKIITKRVFPYLIGITYNAKTGFNFEGDFYLPRSVKLSWPYIVNYSILDGLFLSVNAGSKTTGLGVGYGLFTRSLGTVGTNFCVRTLYCFANSQYVSKNEFYINAEFEQIVLFNCFECGYLKKIHEEETSSGMFYIGWGLKF